MNPDDGCPSCGTIDRHHAPECNYIRRRMTTDERGQQLARRFPNRKTIGDACDVCEGPCRYGNCKDCGGHSEHNYGCPQTVTAKQYWNVWYPVNVGDGDGFHFYCIETGSLQTAHTQALGLSRHYGSAVINDGVGEVAQYVNGERVLTPTTD